MINLQRENWTQRRRVKGDDVIPVPAGLDDLQAAMLRINPPTARLLLSDLVALRPGDWIIQNVANSAVGRFVIRLARARGVRTVNVVRRESLFAELTALGADVCVVDGPELAETRQGSHRRRAPSASASTRSRAGPPRASRPASARAAWSATTAR